MFTIRHAGIKGLGVFASRLIPRGTRIASETPLLVVERENDVLRQVNSLSQSERQYILRLSSNPTQRASVFLWAEAAWQTSLHTLGNLFPRSAIPEERLSRVSLQERLNLLHIFRNNNFDLANGQQALFHTLSRFNHSCVPNSQGNLDPKTGRFNLHAVKTIPEGDEITLSYLVDHGGVRAARQDRLQQNYGFLCDCPICDSQSSLSQASEIRRSHARHMLEEYAQRAQELSAPDLSAELSVMQALIDQLESDGVYGRELATTYIAAAEVCKKLEDQEKASRYALKGLELEEITVGKDSQIFLNSRDRVQALLGS